MSGLRIAQTQGEADAVDIDVILAQIPQVSLEDVQTVITDYLATETFKKSVLTISPVFAQTTPVVAEQIKSVAPSTFQSGTLPEGTKIIIADSAYGGGAVVGGGTAPGEGSGTNGQGYRLDGTGLHLYRRDNVRTVWLDALTGNAVFTGVVNAQGGNFTGNITGGSFYGGIFATSPNVGNGTASSQGVIINSSGIGAYPASSSIPSTSISASNGTLTAIGATISGTITASAGTIGGFTIGSTTITGGSLQLSSTGAITGGTITGSLFQTASSGNRIVINGSGAGDRIQFFTGLPAEISNGSIVVSYMPGTTRGAIYVTAPNTSFTAGYTAYLNLVSADVDNVGGSSELHSPGELSLTCYGRTFISGSPIELYGLTKRGGGSAQGTNFYQRSHNTTFTTTNNTWTDTFYNTEGTTVADNGSIASSPNLISNAAGIFLCHGMVTFDASATGVRGARFLTQGGTVITYMVVSASVQDTPECSGTAYLPGGGYTVKFQRFQNSGATLGSPSSLNNRLNFTQVA